MRLARRGLPRAFRANHRAPITGIRGRHHGARDEQVAGQTARTNRRRHQSTRGQRHHRRPGCRHGAARRLYPADWVGQHARPAVRHGKTPFLRPSQGLRTDFPDQRFAARARRESRLGNHHAPATGRQGQSRTQAPGLRVRRQRQRIPLRDRAAPPGRQDRHAARALPRADGSGDGGSRRGSHACLAVRAQRARPDQVRSVAGLGGDRYATGFHAARCAHDRRSGVPQRGLHQLDRVVRPGRHPACHCGQAQQGGRSRPPGSPGDRIHHELGRHPVRNSPEDFSRFVADEMAKWRKAGTEAGIQPTGA